jgi:hypothetical protein
MHERPMEFTPPPSDANVSLSLCNKGTNRPIVRNCRCVAALAWKKARCVGVRVCVRGGLSDWGEGDSTLGVGARETLGLVQSEAATRVTAEGARPISWARRFCILATQNDWDPY